MVLLEYILLRLGGIPDIVLHFVYWLYSMNAPFGRTRVPSPTNLKMCDRTKPNLDSTHDRTKPNLDSTHELRGCARTVRSSSKASNPTFQPLIGSQAPTPEVLVPVINLVCFSVPNPLCCIDSGGRAGLLTKPYKIQQVQIL